MFTESSYNIQLTNHFLIQFLIFHCRSPLFDQNWFDFRLFVKTTNMKKCRYNLFHVTRGHAHNLVSCSGNFCDRFLVFLRSSTFKPKREQALCKIQCYRKIILQHSLKHLRKLENKNINNHKTKYFLKIQLLT